MPQRLAIFTLLTLMMLASGAVARESMQTSPPQTEDTPRQTGPTVERSIAGCLAFNGHTFILAVGADIPKQYRVVGGDTTPLRGKVGHTMQINGPAGKSDPREMILNANMIDATTGVGYDTIVAQKVEDLLPNCAMAGFERTIH